MVPSHDNHSQVPPIPKFAVNRARIQSTRSLGDCLHAQRLQYPFSRNLVGHIAAFFERNGANNCVHRVSKDEVDTRRTEIFRLHKRVSGTDRK